MQSVLRFIENTNTKTATVFIISLALVVLGIDLITGREVQFPLIYVLPVGIAAWRNQKTLAYAMSIVLPLVRGIYEFPWHTSASLPIASINTLMEIAALMLYSYLVDKTATQKKTATKDDYNKGTGDKPTTRLCQEYGHNTTRPGALSWNGGRGGAGLPAAGKRIDLRASGHRTG